MGSGHHGKTGIHVPRLVVTDIKSEEDNVQTQLLSMVASFVLETTFNINIVTLEGVERIHQMFCQQKPGCRGVILAGAQSLVVAGK